MIEPQDEEDGEEDPAARQHWFPVTMTSHEMPAKGNHFLSPEFFE